MFGQNNNDQNQQPNQPDPNQALQDSTPPPPPGFMSPSAPSMDMGSAPVSDNNDSPQPDDQGAPMIMDDNPTSFVSPATPDDMAAEASAPPAPSSAPANSDDLLSMKQQALQQLTPLVNHLDQSPEEKFRTVMMMIQASDDHTKLGEAFEAAKAITDDKARAQALLDVINEINYFTQHQN